MRILFVNQYFPPDISATAYLLGELSEDLGRHHDVWVIAGQPSYNPESGTYRPERVRVERTWSTTFSRATMVSRFLNYGSFVGTALLRGWRVPRPDVVVALTDPPVVGLIGLLVARASGSPFVYVCHDIFPDVGIALRRLDNPIGVALLRRVNRYLREQADRIVVIGRDMEQKLRQEGVPSDKLVFLPNWANSQALEPARVEATRRRMGWEDRFVVMHAGNMGLAQNLNALVEAATTLAAHPEILIVFLGDGAAKPALQREVQRRRLRNVVFMPYRPKDEAQTLMAAADVHVVSLAPGLWGCVVPSKMYGIMAAARPFVASVELDSEPALVAEENDCGIRIDPADPVSLVEAILKMREEPLDDMGRRGREAFERMYERSVATANYQAVLEEIAGGDGHGAARRGGVRARVASDGLPTVMRVITRLNVGGPARHVTLLTESLDVRGFVSELVSGKEGPREGIVAPSGGRHVRISSLKRELSPVADVQAARILTQLMREHRPDIVHTHLAKAGALGRYAARRARVPVVIHTYHGHVLSGYFPSSISRGFAATERALALWTDALIAVSPRIRDELISLGIGSPSQWHVIPLGLDLTELLREPPPRDAVRASLGLPANGPLVGIVGRLVPIKDHQTFLEAAVRIAAARPDATFVVAGDGELRRDLERDARSMLGDRVRFLGWAMDLPALYAALDVVVLTSRREGTPTALIEAGAAARPVVATNVGGVPDVVRDGVTGSLVPHGRPSAVAAGVLEILAQPEKGLEMGRHAREWVKERFSSQRLADDLAVLYSDLLDRRGIRTRRTAASPVP